MEQNIFLSGLILHVGVFLMYMFMNCYIMIIINFNCYWVANMMKKFLDIDIEKLLVFIVEVGGG